MVHCIVLRLLSIDEFCLSFIRTFACMMVVIFSESPQTIIKPGWKPGWELSVHMQKLCFLYN